MPAITQNDNAQWKDSKTRYFGGKTQERVKNGKKEFISFIDKVKIKETTIIINNKEYWVRKIFNFKNKEFLLEIQEDNGSSKVISKYYKNSNELNKAVINANTNLDTFIDRTEESQNLKKIIDDIRNLKATNSLTSSLAALNQNDQLNNSSNDLLNLITTFQYLSILENFHEKCLSHAKEESSFLTKITIAPLLLSAVVTFKVIQKIATTLPMKEGKQSFEDYQNALLNLQNFAMAGIDILLNSLITAKLSKVAQKIFFASKEKQAKKTKIQEFNFDNFLDLLAETLESLEEKNIYDNNKYLEEIKVIKEFITELKGVETQDKLFTTLPDNFKNVVEGMFSDETKDKASEQAKQLINKTFSKFTEETNTFEGISWWNSTKNIAKESVAFALSAISITGASRNTLARGEAYDLKKWITQDIFEWKDWVGNFVRYAFLYPSSLVFEKAFKIMNIPLNKPFEKLTNLLNNLSFNKKMSAAVGIFAFAVAFSNIIKTESSLVAANPNDIPQTLEDLWAVMQKVTTIGFSIAGTGTDMINCFIKGTYDNWTKTSKTLNIKEFPLKLLEAFKKEFSNLNNSAEEEIIEVVVEQLTSQIDQDSAIASTSSSVGNLETVNASQKATIAPTDTSESTIVMIDSAESLAEETSEWTYPQSQVAASAPPQESLIEKTAYPQNTVSNASSQESLASSHTTVNVTNNVTNVNNTVNNEQHFCNIL